MSSNGGVDVVLQFLLFTEHHLPDSSRAIRLRMAFAMAGTLLVAADKEEEEAILATGPTIVVIGLRSTQELRNKSLHQVQ